MDNLINGLPFDMMNPRHRNIIQYLNDFGKNLGKDSNLKAFCKSNWLQEDLSIYSTKSNQLKSELKQHPEDIVLLRSLINENKFNIVQKCVTIIKNKIETWEIFIA